MSAAPETIDLLYPLSFFQRQNGGTLPAYEVIEGGDMPAPFQRLLVHTGDMTSRLEAFHGGEIALSVLHRQEVAGLYQREVILRLRATGQPVEYGAIEIDLGAFEPALRTLILEGRLPLGGLLNAHGVRYHSRPRAFLRVGPEAHLARLFDVTPEHQFYGRCNELHGDGERVLARIVEVLPP